MSLPSPNIQSAKSEISAENQAKSKNPDLSEELTHNQGKLGYKKLLKYAFKLDS